MSSSQFTGLPRSVPDNPVTFSDVRIRLPQHPKPPPSVDAGLFTEGYSRPVPSRLADILAPSRPPEEDPVQAAARRSGPVLSPLAPPVARLRQSQPDNMDLSASLRAGTVVG
jgi:hypothetical protein